MSQTSSNTAAIARRTARSRLLELRAIDYIPRDERHGKVWHQGPFWFASNFFFTTMTVGFAGPLSGLGLGWTTLAIVLGALFSTLFMALHACQGPRLGVPQLLQSRAQFGTHGVMIALIATVITYVDFNVQDVATATQGVQAVLGTGPIWPWCVGMLTVQFLIAAMGHDVIHRTERGVFYVLLLPFAALTVGVLMIVAPMHVLVMGSFSTVAFFTQVMTSATFLISWIIYVSDYTRYLPSDTRPVPLLLWTYAGGVVSSIWLMPLGALIAVAVKNGASLAGVLTIGNRVAPGLGTAVLLLSSISLMIVMSLNTYGASLAALTAVDGYRRIRSPLRARLTATLALTIVMLALALLLSESAQGWLANFAGLTVAILIPWSTINLVDYYWVRRRQYSVVDLFNGRASVYGSWSWRGLTAWAAGVFAMIPFFAFPFLTGPVTRALGGVDLSIVAGTVVSGLVYLVLAHGLDTRAEQSAYQASLAALESSAVRPVVAPPV